MNPVYYSVNPKTEFEKQQVSEVSELWTCEETEAKSLHAITEILPGDVISPIRVKEWVEKPSYLSVQIKDDQHILLDPFFLQYINHSCDPNVFFDTENMVVTCIKKINPKEAMTFFYPSTEWLMTQSFDCLCGSEKCLNKIQGAKYLSPNLLQQYDLSKHIEKRLQLSLQFESANYQ